MNKEELDDATGYNQVIIPRFPYIKFSATERGSATAKTFSLLTQSADGGLDAKDLGDEINVVFVSRGYFKLKKGKYSTNEIVPVKGKKFDLWQIDKTNGRRAFVESGEWRDLKTKYNLATFQYPYVLLDNQICKLAIQPSSLGNYWGYCNEFKGEERVYEFITALKAEDKSKQNKDGGEYFVINFERKDIISKKEFENVSEKIMELKEIKDKIKSNYEARSASYNPETGGLTNEEVINLERDSEQDSEDSNTINIDDVPIV